FDQAGVPSIGAIAVAPSNPRILYIGTGDVTAGTTAFGAVNRGDGVWRSDDAGRHWRHIGLAHTEHIGAIWIDPKDPDTVLVAALGRASAPDRRRGVYRTVDGGRTWTQTLFVDAETGVVDLAADAARPGVIYAAAWRHQLAVPPAALTGGGEGGGAIYKSADGGRSWRRLSGHGLPDWRMGRVGLAAAGGRVLAVICRGNQHRPGGLFRSDDGGATWRSITRDPRIAAGDRDGYFGRVWMDPQNRNVVYVVKTSFYRSTDGGQTFSVLKGAPGGDDYHVLWMDPGSPCLPLASAAGCASSEMILGSDQGASVSLNAGRTWSSWYNQPTAQVYHIATDRRFPFRIYGTQQDSGSFEVRSRGVFGAIGPRDWRPAMGAYEYGYIQPDPARPQWVFASGDGGEIRRLTRPSGQILNVTPAETAGAAYRYAFGPYRQAAAPPFLFSPLHPGVLLEGTQFVLATADGGRHWRRISPDLTLRPDLPPRQIALGKTRRHWAAISALGPSPLRAGVLWAGTDDGLIQVTQDGGRHWRTARLSALGPFDTVTMIEASPFDPAAAYAVVDRHLWGDLQPYIYRTRDYGQSWQAIAAGIPNGSFVRVVRADPLRRGLLYAGTETGVYVSFDDGGRWQSLQLNLPTVAVRDLRLRAGNLVAATFGRAIWILDDLSPLRQLDAAVAAAPAHLFRPAAAYRIRRDVNTDTPPPPEVPAGANPPAGAVLDYTLRSAPAAPIALAIYSASGRLVRRFTSAPPPAPTGPKWPTIAAYWMAPAEPLPARAGMNRFVWDLRYAAPASLGHSYPMTALVHGTPLDPRGPLALPGRYTLALTVSGQTYRQPLTIRPDPRGAAPQRALAAQLALARAVMAGMRSSFAGYQAAQRRNAAAAAQRFAALNGALAGLLGDVESADAAPTPRMFAAARQLLGQLDNRRPPRTP
ncbi:MAG: WD40/YVTN/BNR-like repeat-containing protein, partial [Terriglobales bacterium]